MLYESMLKELYFDACYFKSRVQQFNYLAGKTMKRFYLLCLFIAFLFVNSAWAQNESMMDSLLKILKTANEDTNQVKILNQISYKFPRNKPEMALKYADEALKMSLKLRWEKGEVESNYRIADIYNSQSDFARALEYYLKSLKIIELHSELKILSGDIYQDIGNLYKVSDDYESALKYLLMARQVYKQFRLQKGIAPIGDVYYHEKNYPMALKYYREALSVDDDNRCIDLIRIGKVYMMLHKYAEADSFLIEAIKLSRERNEETQTGIGLQILAKIYLSEVNGHFPLEEDPKTHLEKALTLAKESESICKRISSSYDIIDTYKVLIEISSALKDYKAANTYYELLFSAKDKIFNETSGQQLAALQTKYETEIKDKEIFLLNADKKLKDVEIKKQTLFKNSLVSGLALLLVLFFFIYKNYRAKQKLKLETIRNNIAADLHDDIGSTLNSISLFSEVAKQEAGKPIPALEEIGVSARKIIDAMSDIVWTINQENDTFENVISRMRSLFYMLLKAKAIEFSFKADENLNHLSLAIPVRKNFYLLFKEAINNLVKYSNATRVSSHISLENKNVKMIIRDNGIGFDMEHTQMGNGIKNMKRRAAEIGAKLLIESSEGKGTNIELSFKTK
jgi:two-component system sensor histidine kinase UhpB